MKRVFARWRWSRAALAGLSLALLAPTAAPADDPAVLELDVTDPESQGSEEKPDPAEQARLDALATPTHRQTAVIKIGGEDDPVTVATFCLTRDGALLAACPRAKLEGEEEKSGAQLRLLSPKGELLKTVAIDFTPQAINVDAAGNIYVGGAQSLAKYSADGKRLVKNDAPNVVDMDAMMEKMRKQVRRQYETAREQMQRRLEGMQELLATQEERLAGLKAEEAEAGEQAPRTKGDEPDADEEERATEADRRKLQIEVLTGQIQHLKAQLPMYERHLEHVRSRAEPTDEQIRQMIRYRTQVAGIACGPAGIYVACSATEGYGYEIWLLKSDLTDPKKIAGDQRGCCGQFDIQAHGDTVYAAANCRFSVVGFNGEGEETICFGKRGGGDIEGFGSCCNPMNIRFAPNGDCYTAEASVGAIKRFNKDGKFQGVVAQAELVPGCKHVAIDVTPDGERVYMLDITRSQIYVFERGPGD